MMDKTPQKPDPNEQYAGPSPSIIRLGYAQGYGILGNVVGALVGLVGAESITRSNPKYIEPAIKFLNKFNLKNQEKLAIRIGGAAVGFLTAHWIGFFTGLCSNWSKGTIARDQFERVKNERDEAITKVEVLENTLNKHEEQEHPKRFAEKHTAQQAEHGSHAAAHLADKHAADASEHTRA